MFDGDMEIRGRKIPRTLLGTSPFIGAAQFGHRSRLYQLDLYNQPENILKIIEKSYGLGVTGIQLVPFQPVVQALKWAVEEGCELEIVGTVRPDCEDRDIDLLVELGASAMLLHGAITDKLNWDFIGERLQDIKDMGSIPGLVTHNPFKTTLGLLESSVLDLFDIYMVPVNKIGYLMDTQEFLDKERSRFRELIKGLNKKIIAKKILAAGILEPEQAFDYLKILDYVDIVALGIASEVEAQETFQLLAMK